ncbi:unnamed protein product [Ascophyllum nodosum]
MDTRGNVRYSSSEASRGGGSHGLGHGCHSSFKPRLLGRDEQSFVLEFLRSCGPDRAGHRRGTRSGGSDMIRECAYDNADDTISLEMFVEFCRWWEPVTNTLSLMLDEWASVDPVKVQGFMGGKEAERLLLKKRLPGVFLLRFSKSSPERLVLTYTCKASQDMSSGQARKNGSKGCPVVITRSYVTVRPDGWWTLHYGKGMEGISYPSLRDLVNSKVHLLTLYPSSAKGDAFETS